MLESNAQQCSGAGRVRILFVGMHHSIHAARWLESVYPSADDLHFFALDPGEPHEYLRAMTIYRPQWVPAAAPGTAEPHPFVAVPLPDAAEVSTGAPVTERHTASIPPLRERFARFARLASNDPREALHRVSQRLRRRLAPNPVSQPQAMPTGPTHAEAPLRTVYVRVPFAAGEPHDPDRRVRLGREDESDATAPALHGPDVLARVIREVEPDLIHSMEYQHSAYLVLAARDHLARTHPEYAFPRWLATNWGSDIFLFGREAGHARQIKRVNEALDLYSCECHRDIDLGRQFGYRGPVMPVLPNSGGIDVEAAQVLRAPSPPSKRKVIMVKGYDHFAGRAMVSLAVIEKFAARLRDYEIVMFSVGVNPRVRALELKAAGTLNIKVIDWATHNEILEHFGRARMYLGVSVSDGISTSVLEAMMMGAFPIQTDTSCCTEWFVDGETGLAVSPDDVDGISAAFERALTDDGLVDRAAPRNLEIIRSRLDRSVITPRVADFYRKALSAPRRERQPA